MRFVTSMSSRMTLEHHRVTASVQAAPLSAAASTPLPVVSARPTALSCVPQHRMSCMHTTRWCRHAWGRHPPAAGLTTAPPSTPSRTPAAVHDIKATCERCTQALSVREHAGGIAHRRGGARGCPQKDMLGRALTLPQPLPPTCTRLGGGLEGLHRLAQRLAQLWQLAWPEHEGRDAADDHQLRQSQTKEARHRRAGQPVSPVRGPRRAMRAQCVGVSKERRARPGAAARG